MNFTDKVHVLKSFEKYSYQITYHLLKDQAEAIEACSRGLIKAFQDHDFFQLTDDLQKKRIRLIMLVECALVKRRM